eukprot:gene21970-29027_t
MQSLSSPSVARASGMCSKRACKPCVVSCAAERPISTASADASQIGRRQAAAILVGGTATLFMSPPKADAFGFQKELTKRKLTDADYSMSDELGFLFAELAPGKGGQVVKKGDRVICHFDVMYRSIDIVSSRQARLLGGNRTISEPFEFIVGEAVQEQAAKSMTDSAGGLFSGQGGPKPPPVLSRAVIGMKKGGKRSIKVTDAAADGYGSKGIGEMPGNTPFELRVEVLSIFSS